MLKTRHEKRRRFTAAVVLFNIYAKLYMTCLYQNISMTFESYGLKILSLSLLKGGVLF
jgi:hypothetical protein